MRLCKPSLSQPMIGSMLMLTNNINVMVIMNLNEMMDKSRFVEAELREGSQEDRNGLGGTEGHGTTQSGNESEHEGAGQLQTVS